MNERYSPGAFVKDEPRQPEEKIQMFFDEFPWLEGMLREKAGPRWRLTGILTNVRVAKMHHRVAEFYPYSWLINWQLNEAMNSFVDNRRTTDTNWSVSWYTVSFPGVCVNLPVGHRNKWTLVSRPRWYAPWRKYKVALKDNEFAENIEDCIRRTCAQPWGISCLVQVCLKQVEDYPPKYKVVIYRVPKDKNILDWIQEDKKLMIQEGRDEIREAVLRAET